MDLRRVDLPAALKATIAGQAYSIAADGLVILVTWVKLSRGLGSKHGLAYVLLRDGG